MAKGDISSIENVETSLEQSGVSRKKKEVVKDEPFYKMLGDSKIPVSKYTGMLWKGRRDEGIHNMKQAIEAWDEAIMYYENDQSSHREGGSNTQSNNTLYAKRLNNNHTETENVVFSNCSLMVPMLYSKNPDITVSDELEENQNFVRMVERLCDKLMDMGDNPGLAMKRKLRKAILIALLTNSAYAKIGFTAKQFSLEDAQQELLKVSAGLENAKSKKEIVEIEGKLQAIEERIDTLSVSGPTVKILLPHKVVCDPVNDMWMMEYDYLSTAYLNAVYGTKDENGDIVSTYNPTHILSNGSGSGEDTLADTVNNFVAINVSGTEADAKANGFENVAAYEKAQYTKVWYVWDKSTRRVFMFSDCNWEYPIWVWDDPLRLPRFFPYFKLWFHESPVAKNPKGETTYYLDQQDAINEINDEIRRGRAWAKRNVFFNKNLISQQDVEQVLKGADGTARGVDIPEGGKLDEVIMSITPPALKFPELFDTSSKIQAINRITGVNEVARGAQFKTNTTTSAVQEYRHIMDVRTDERIDLIEDFVADIMRNIVMLCSLNWDAQDVEPIIGQTLAKYWVHTEDPRLLYKFNSIKVVGGSTAKPTSKEMKAMAIELGQILGQFASASPAVIIIMLKMLEKAFRGNFSITDEDWEMVKETMMQALNKAGSGQDSGQQQQGGEQQEQGVSEEEVKARIEGLPPEAKEAIAQLIQQGLSPSEALQGVEEQMQQQMQQPQ